MQTLKREIIIRFSVWRADGKEIEKLHVHGLDAYTEVDIFKALIDGDDSGKLHRNMDGVLYQGNWEATYG